MLGRHGAQLPHRVLPSFAEAFQTLGIADRARLPVRIRRRKKWYTRCSNVCPASVIPSSAMCVKSDAHSRPGTCTCPKYTSCAGPSVTRRALIRRCSVRICPSLNRPGCSRCSHSNSVLTCGPGLSSICFCTASHTSLNGSPRVRQGRSFFSSLGNRSSRSYLRAVAGSIPAFAAAIS